MDALLDLISHPTQPAVLVLEDVQWADEATLDVVRFLGRRIARANGLLVLTYRDAEVVTDHPLRQIFGELPLCLASQFADQFRGEIPSHQRGTRGSLWR